LEEFDYEHQRSLKRDTIAHLGTLDFVAAKENVVFLGPPGTGKTHLSIGLGIRACQAGHRVAFATAAEWVARLADASHAGRLQDEIIKLGRIPLLIVDEVGYIPFEPESANLFFQLVSARYERASLIITSNKPFGRWGEVFGDDIVAAAMIDRLIHHAEVISLNRIQSITVRGLQGQVTIVASACAWTITVAAGTVAEVEIKGVEGETIRCDGVPLPNPDGGQPTYSQAVLPAPFLSQSDVPSGSAIDIRPDAGTIHVLTSGPITVLGIRLPGGSDRGSVVVFLPGTTYHVTGLVPTKNWHGAYSLASEHWSLVKDDRVAAMLSGNNCTIGGCKRVDWLVIGPSGKVDQGFATR
jgi:hypothetical protein